MQYLNLDAEEKELLEEFEKGEWQSSKTFKKDKKKAEEAAKYTLNKTKNINIRLSFKDLEKIKTKAAEAGLPYQTLIALVLHYFAKDRIRIKI